MFNSNNSIGTAEPGDVGGEGSRRRGARQKYALEAVRIKNIRERKRKRSLPIKAIGQIATSSNVQVT